MSSQQTIEDSPLVSAIRLNNEAVRQTLDGCDEQAVASFSQSLSIFRSLISQDASTDGVTTSPSILHSASTVLPGFGEKNFFLFNSVIAFADIKEHAPADNHIYCAAIILNIAVIHHRQAVLGRQGSLIKAERFYDMVTKIVSGNTEERGTALMIKLAAVNNLSQIRFEEGNYRAAEEGFHQLAWLVSSTEAENGSVLNAQQLEGMLLNVLMANRQTAAAAA